MGKWQKFSLHIANIVKQQKFFLSKIIIYVGLQQSVMCIQLCTTVMSDVQYYYIDCRNIYNCRYCDNDKNFLHHCITMHVHEFG